jgi:hypothetical protein
MNMCVINPVFVNEIRRLAGSQAEIMGRIGISWNTLTKIVAGQPIRLSVGERLKARVIQALGSGREGEGAMAARASQIEDLDRSFLSVVVISAKDTSGPKAAARESAPAQVVELV